MTGGGACEKRPIGQHLRTPHITRGVADVADRNERLRWTTKLIYGVGDVGNAVVNSAIQFFLMIFYTECVMRSTCCVLREVQKEIGGYGLGWEV
jgi:hypothetical protein